MRERHRERLKRHTQRENERERDDITMMKKERLAFFFLLVEFCVFFLVCFFTRYIPSNTFISSVFPFRPPISQLLLIVVRACVTRGNAFCGLGVGLKKINEKKNKKKTFLSSGEKQLEQAAHKHRDLRPAELARTEQPVDEHDRHLGEHGTRFPGGAHGDLHLESVAL